VADFNRNKNQIVKAFLRLQTGSIKVCRGHGACNIQAVMSEGSQQDTQAT